jgi:SsrA-binding protein
LFFPLEGNNLLFTAVSSGRTGGCGIKVISRNKKARHDYHILETYEAGLVLLGSEIKSLRQGKCNFKDSYAAIDGGEAYLYNLHIPPYEKGGAFNHDPDRPKKLLLHKKEIFRLYGKVREKGLTLVPLEVGIKDGWAKVTLALAKGRRVVDKREVLKKRTDQREMKEVLKNRGRNGAQN